MLEGYFFKSLLNQTDNLLQPTERIGRSALRDDKVPADLLILSCEEDYDICIPFLEKGGKPPNFHWLVCLILIMKFIFTVAASRQFGRGISV